MNNGIEDLLLMVGVGIIVGAVSNVISHFLAMSREQMRQEWEEAQQDDDDCADSPLETATTETK